MSRRIVLREIAHARAGDKGNTSNISVWARDPADYPMIRDHLTAEAVKVHFGDQVRGEVVRFELPHLHGLNFVLRDALDGGVNGSLGLDGHGKSWSMIMLSIELEVSQ